MKYITFLLLLAFAFPSWAEALKLKALEKGFKQFPIGAGVDEAISFMGNAQYLFEDPNKNFFVFGYCRDKLLSSSLYVTYFNGTGHLFYKEQQTYRGHKCRKLFNTLDRKWADIGVKAILEKHPNTDLYEIDKLRVRVFREKSSQCINDGLLVWLQIDGEIGPDSSFAVRRIFEREKTCDTADVEKDITVVLNSGGGLLKHGYLLGELLKEYRASAFVNTKCASSCAVGFLGARRRQIGEDASLMFHAPYYLGRNALGGVVASCEVDADTLQELRYYYQRMIGEKDGQRLFERTMTYCSSNDGWVLTGNAAAELYGVTNPYNAVLGD